MKSALLVLLIAACGGGAKSARAPAAKPTSGAGATTSKPAADSSLPKEIGEIEEQNAAHLGAIRELETGIQGVDDSEDAPAKRRAELQKLRGQRDELVKAVTATRARAQAAASTRDADPDLLKRAEEQRDRAEKSLRELEDLKTQITTIAKRL